VVAVTWERCCGIVSEGGGGVGKYVVELMLFFLAYLPPRIPSQSVSDPSRNIADSIIRTF
jgi:hypothetical protein